MKIKQLLEDLQYEVLAGNVATDISTLVYYS